MPAAENKRLIVGVLVSRSECEQLLGCPKRPGYFFFWAVSGNLLDWELFINLAS